MPRTKDQQGKWMRPHRREMWREDSGPGAHVYPRPNQDLMDSWLLNLRIHHISANFYFGSAYLPICSEDGDARVLSNTFEELIPSSVLRPWPAYLSREDTLAKGEAFRSSSNHPRSECSQDVSTVRQEQTLLLQS